MNTQVTVNHKQGLFVIPNGEGVSCLGFDVCRNRTIALGNEMKESYELHEKNTIEAYNEYRRLVDTAFAKNLATGWRSQSELIPEFIGKEGKKVTVTDNYGETRTFRIGKSTGFIPCHLEIEGNEDGGGAVTGYPFSVIKFGK